MKSKVLVVGGAGYVGGYLVDLLLDKPYMTKCSYPDYSVTVYDNLLYEDLYLKKVNFIKGDVRDQSKLSKILNDYDVVVWLAAIVGDGACKVSVKTTEEVNRDSLIWLTENYSGKIIFTSTCSVYGVNNDLLTEDAEPNPLSEYAETKLEAEQYLTSYHVDHLVFRLGTLYGQGDDFSRTRLDLVSNILACRAAMNEPLKVFGGEQWRPLLHVKDVARAIQFGIENPINGLYNLVDENYTIKGIAEQIKQIVPSTKIEYQDLPFEDLRDYKVAPSKLNQLGFKPEYSLADGIKEIVKLVKEGRIENPLDNPLYSNEKYLEYLLGKGKYGNE
tara:strand:- start:5379 stop:6371 length:993 start_codon:yes stop_codon:yes gene_type:complete